LLSNKQLADFFDEIESFDRIQAKVTVHVANLKDSKLKLAANIIDLELNKQELNSQKVKLSDQRYLAQKAKLEKNELLKETENKESKYKEFHAMVEPLEKDLK